VVFINVEALTFTFSGDSSVNYDVYLVSFGGSSGWITNSAGSNKSMITNSVPRNAEQLFYGVEQNDPKQFSVTIGSNRPKSRAEVDRVLGWLLTMKPEHLIANQPDMEFYRYTGIFSNPQLVTLAGRPFGMRLTFTCLSPYAYTFPKKQVIDITHPVTYCFNNDSSDSDYLYPALLLQPSNVTQSFSIVNNSDNGREFRFDFASPFPNGNEIVTIDNRLQVIQSSMGFSRQRFTQFNNNWLRFVRGRNELQITGNGRLELQYKFARRIGS